MATPKFVDEAFVNVQGGKGGDGIVAGRREKYIAYGGPAGGDGGDGGNVIFEASKDENTLLKYRYKRKFSAQNGQMGRGDNQHGKKGEDLILKVPVGTVIKDRQTGKVINILQKDGQKFVVARGGRGGWGNARFATATRQFPTFALKGEPGDKLEIDMELQLFGDVALIGMPSVGKSSLINTLAGTKLEVAEYPFTTLTPHLGVVKHKEVDFALVDIPGIIKGAHQGKGLGLFFLRHILKAKIWTFVLDITKGYQTFEDFGGLWQEIDNFVKKYVVQFDDGDGGSYDWHWHIKDGYLKVDFVKNKEGKSKILFSKAIFLLFNKADLLDDKEIQDDLIDNFANQFANKFQLANSKLITNNIFVVSAFVLDTLQPFLDYLIKAIGDLDIEDFWALLYQNSNLDEQAQSSPYIFEANQFKEFLQQNGYVSEEWDQNVWEVYHPYLSWLAWVLPWDNEEAILRFWKQIQKKGVLNWLLKEGVKTGDVLRIVPSRKGREPFFLQMSI